jgi:lipopolysaccharide/colanic/teichoic acid biosynthesis glycosyltransferase
MGVGATITVTLDVILIPRLGAMGGAITSAVTYLATTMVLVALARRQFRVAARTEDFTLAKPKIVADSIARRAVDIVVSGIALAIAGPLIVLLAGLVRLTSRGPAFYRQVRVGRAVEQFTMLKLRSMVTGADQAGPLVTSREDSRVTKLGALLRAAKLDELPQLVNVLKGDMTLIGPRPEVPRFIHYYNDEELQILNVRPGLTGPGQIFYTQVQQATVLDGEVPEQHYATHELHPKLAIDLDYLRRRSFGHDLWIVVRTALLLAKLAKPAPAPAAPVDDKPAVAARYLPAFEEDDAPTIVLAPYAPMRPDDAPTILMVPHPPAGDERDDAATIIMARYQAPVTDDAPTMALAAWRRPWLDNAESTIVMAAVPASSGAVRPSAGPVGQASPQQGTHLARDARPAAARRSLTVAEALPATIAANRKQADPSRTRFRFYLTLLAVVAAAGLVGSFLVLVLR